MISAEGWAPHHTHFALPSPPPNQLAWHLPTIARFSRELCMRWNSLSSGHPLPSIGLSRCSTQAGWLHRAGSNASSRGETGTMHSSQTTTSLMVFLSSDFIVESQPLPLEQRRGWASSAAALRNKLLHLGIHPEGFFWMADENNGNILQPRTAGWVLREAHKTTGKWNILSDFSLLVLQLLCVWWNHRFPSGNEIPAVTFCSFLLKAGILRGILSQDGYFQRNPVNSQNQRKSKGSFFVPVPPGRKSWSWEPQLLSAIAYTDSNLHFLPQKLIVP